MDEDQNCWEPGLGRFIRRYRHGLYSIQPRANAKTFLGLFYRDDSSICQSKASRNGKTRLLSQSRAGREDLIVGICRSISRHRVYTLHSALSRYFLDEALRCQQILETWPCARYHVYRHDESRDPCLRVVTVSADPEGLGPNNTWQMLVPSWKRCVRYISRR